MRPPRAPPLSERYISLLPFSRPPSHLPSSSLYLYLYLSLSPSPQFFSHLFCLRARGLAAQRETFRGKAAKTTSRVTDSAETGTKCSALWHCALPTRCFYAVIFPGLSNTRSYRCTLLSRISPSARRAARRFTLSLSLLRDRSPCRVSTTTGARLLTRYM